MNTRRFSSGAFAIACMVGIAPSVHPQNVTHVVITGPEIQAAGWQRINEILDVAPGWRLASTDGFTYTPSPDGLPAVGASGLTAALPGVYVNDTRVPIELLGVQELEFVPALLAQLDSVVLSSEPQLVAGRIEMRGTVRFYTRRPPGGISARGEFQVGDVSNKPGLYWYTPMNPPNREHIGPFEHLLLGFGGTRVGLDIGVRYATLNTTDTLIQHRRVAFGGTAAISQINVPAPVAHLDVTGIGGRHTIDATRAHYSGLFFIPAYGHEQSLRMDATSVVAGGEVQPGRGLGIRYGADYTNDEVSALPSGYPSTLMHRRQGVDGVAELSHAVGTTHLAVGVGGQQWSFDRLDTARSRSNVRTFARADHIVTGPLATSASVVLTHSAHASTGGGLLSTEWKPSEADAVRLVVASQAEDPEDDGRWIDSELLSVPNEIVLRRMTTADLEWTRLLAHDISLLTGAGVSSASKWPVALPSDTGFFELNAVMPPRPVLGDIEVARASVGLETGRHPRWYGRVLYSYTSPIGGDSALRKADRSIARHQVNGQAWVVPARDWRVMTLVQMVSSAYWAAYPRLASGWPPDVAGFSRVDLGVEKWMWNRHLRFQYEVRDVFNRSERWQPRSAEYNLRWLASASFVLGASD